MKPALLERLRCPRCIGNLEVRFGDGTSDLREGLLTCRCGEWFPVVRGIPRMLLSPYREAFLQREAEWVSRLREALPPWEMPEVKGEDRVQQATAERFGAEWRTFWDMRKDYERLFHSYFDVVDVDSFRGRVVLDAGCGMGRWAAFCARAGASVVAVDLGPAVEVAAKNLEPYPHAHVVQADLLRLPFESRSFDAVYSMGVLHHLPDPEAGFRSVAARVAPGGILGIYLYYSLENRSAAHRFLLRAVTILRRATVRLPHALLRSIAAVWAALFALLFVWPARLLERLGFRRAARALPLSQYGPLEWRVLYNDTVDRFGAPLEARFSREEIRDLFRRAGFREPVIPETFPYWHAWGSLEEKRAATDTI
jgi:SAM-dependent methyltransferase